MAKTLDEMTEPELKAVMSNVGRAVLNELPDGSHFVVLACDPDTRVAQYTSNANLHDVTGWMLETMWRWNRGDHVPR